MTAALRANVDVLAGNYGMSAVVAVERGNSVTPPKLTGMQFEILLLSALF